MTLLTASDHTAARLARLAPHARQVAEQWLAGRPPAAARAPLLNEGHATTWRLSPEQEGFWLEQHLHSGLYRGAPIRNLWVVLSLDGRLDIGALEAALSAIVARHPALRSRFVVREGTPHVEIVSTGLEVIHRDLRPGRASDRVAGGGFEEASLVPFDLRRPPLLKVFLDRLEETRSRLSLLIDHLVFDGWSFGLFVRELSELYSAASTGRPARLATPPATYGDYCRWAAEQRRAGLHLAHLPFWRERLGADLPILMLPTDHPRTEPQPHRSGKRTGHIPAPAAEALTAFAREAGISLFAALQAAFKILLARLAGEEDIAIVCPEANRDRAEFAEVIGCFATGLVIRTCIDQGMSFRSAAVNEHRAVQEALAHKAASFDVVAAEFFPDAPPFRVFFAYENFPLPPFALEGMQVTVEDINYGSSICDIVVNVAPAELGLQMTACYNALLFDPATVDGLLTDFVALLGSLVSAPDSPLDGLPLAGSP